MWGYFKKVKMAMAELKTKYAFFPCMGPYVTTLEHTHKIGPAPLVIRESPSFNFLFTSQ